MPRKLLAATPEQRDKEVGYMLPPDIVAAMSSGRKELLIPAIEEAMKYKRKLDGRALAEVLRLLGDLIEDRLMFSQQLGAADRVIKELVSGIQDAAVSAKARGQRATEMYRTWAEERRAKESEVD